MANRIGLRKPPIDVNKRRLVDRGSQLLIDYQTIGATAQNVIVGQDVKGFTCIVNTGSLTVRSLEPVSVAYLGASAVVDNGDGTVTVACTGHGFTDGDTVRLYQPYVANDGHVALVEYPDAYTILAAGDANSLVFTATYAAKTPTALYYAIGYRDITYAAGEYFTFPTAVEAMQPLFVGTGAATIKLQLWR